MKTNNSRVMPEETREELQTLLDNNLSLDREIHKRNVLLFPDKETAVEASRSHGWQGKVLQMGAQHNFGWIPGKMKRPKPETVQGGQEHITIKVPILFRGGNRTWSRSVLQFIFSPKTANGV